MIKRETKQLSITLIALATICCLVALDIIFAPQKELWLDETHSALLSTMSFERMILFVKGDVHPPLYFIAIWAWQHLFGDSPFALRAFSIFVNSIACVLFFFLSRTVIQNKYFSLITFILFAFSPVLFWYSVEVRMYALLILFTVFSIYLLFKLLYSKSNNLLLNIGVGCALGLTFYTHYMAVFYIIGVFIFLAYKVIVNKEQYLKPFITSGMIVFLITAPWYGVLLHQREAKLHTVITHQHAKSDKNSLEYGITPSIGKKNNLSTQLKESALNLASIAGVYPAENKYFLLLGLLPFLASAIAFLFLLKTRDDFSIFSIIIVATSLIGLILLIGPVERRYIILLTPLIILVLGRSLEKINQYNSNAALIISLALIISYTVGVYRIIKHHYDKPTVELIDTLKSRTTPGQLVVINSIHGQIPIEYYAKQLNFSLTDTGFPISIHKWWDLQKFKGWGSPVIYMHDIKEFMNQLVVKRRLNQFWLVLFESTHYDPDGHLLAYLKANTHSVSLINIYKYNKADVYQLYYIKIK